MIIVTESLERLRHLCDIIPPRLEKISESEFVFQPSPEKWNKKQILGHLIDSAANNHQRFIRIQYENEPIIFYNQNQWVDLSHYKDMDTDHLIRFWTSYNRHLAECIKFIPEENLRLKGVGGDGRKFPLHFYIHDYVTHLEHHLKQLVTY
ncbi:DinB family protein [Dyadobacter sp. LHD-138]|uniref:DinB family protein n=1 Tax=Dyadobacter sp. LHD-138 TaxID=3071413 RepID=UPI0027E1FC00|nr:DinB family protein [Dyadobacter sp. LHD-138]MDQ6481432.1 DinB family protein [Dyadobacter sp. LHD-138]